jgi:RNA polymerase sigma-70 factor, ECF subfamily
VSDAGAASAKAASPAEAVSGGPDTDAEILRAIAEQDLRRALSLCVQAHGKNIGRLCLAMLGSQTDADDVTQETLLSAHQCFAEYRAESSLRAWLLGIARNKCLRYLEKTRRQGARLRLVSPADAPAAADELVGNRARAERARQLLAEVRPSDRDALLLRYSAGLSFKEVALAAGIDEATARKRVSRALLRMRTALTDEDMT